MTNSISSSIKLELLQVPKPLFDNTIRDAVNKWCNPKN